MEPSRSSQARKVVALVEDEPVVRDVTACTLEDHGFGVVEFGSADEALPYLEQHGAMLALVVTDVQMPGRINGLDLAGRLVQRWPKLPILVTSGGPLVDPRILPPAVHFLAKPWRVADMARRVEELAA